MVVCCHIPQTAEDLTILTAGAESPGGGEGARTRKSWAQKNACGGTLWDLSGVHDLSDNVADATLHPGLRTW